MYSLWKWLFLSVSVIALSQQPKPASSINAGVMLAVVSRNDSVLTGGIGVGRQSGKGSVFVEPLARLTQSGEWQSLPCDPKHQNTCRAFEREYLKKPHTYFVVSGDGQGATVRAAPTALDECYFYTGAGSYSGSDIAASAIAAASTESFGESPPLRLLHNVERTTTLKALATLAPGKLDSTLYLRLFYVRLEGRDFVLAQRAFADYAGKPEESLLKHIFTIGTMEQGRFHLLHWKKNIDDEDERVLGTIRLKCGREFLITAVSDPESQWFRVYGIRGGTLAMIYSGGGSSC